jgi:hypothetical protein
MPNAKKGNEKLNQSKNNQCMATGQPVLGEPASGIEYKEN